MGSWRRRGDFNDQSRRTAARKPPNQYWQPAIPVWEKKFCSTVGLVSWSKILDTKKHMHLYENVVQWNDSAGKEAFLNAKKRFWAHMNNLPCDISLPDPNEYIDDVDWESQIDPELILDLDRPPLVLEDRPPLVVEDRPRVLVEELNVFLKSDLLLFYKIAPPTGWGDAEEDLQKNNNQNNRGGGYSNQWEPSKPKRNASGGYNFGYKGPSFHDNNDKNRDQRRRNERGVLRKDRFTYEKQSPWIGTH